MDLRPDLLTDVLGTDVRTARTLLAKRNVDVTEVTVASRDDIPLRGMGLLPLVVPGSRVTAYVVDGRIAAFRSGAAQPAPAQAETPADKPAGAPKPRTRTRRAKDGG